MYIRNVGGKKWIRTCNVWFAISTGFPNRCQAVEIHKGINILFSERSNYISIVAHMSEI